MNLYCYAIRRRLDAHFSHGSDFDYIRLRMRLGAPLVRPAGRCGGPPIGATEQTRLPRLAVSVHMTSVFCPFADFVRFLEAMAIDVQECAFNWDPEGLFAEMRWERRQPGRDGFLTVTWKGSYAGRVQEFSQRMWLDTRQAVRMLYSAFRRFVESSEYDPLRYESLTTGEAFALVVSDTSLDRLADVMSRLDADAARRLAGRLCNLISLHSCGTLPRKRTLSELLDAMASPELDDEVGQCLIPPEWNDWSLERRLSDVRDGLFSGGAPGWYGANLRQLRSQFLEEWLTTGQTQSFRPPPRTSPPING